MRFFFQYPVAGLLRGFKRPIFHAIEKKFQQKKPIGVPDTGRITSTPLFGDSTLPTPKGSVTIYGSETRRALRKQQDSNLRGLLQPDTLAMCCFRPLSHTSIPDLSIWLWHLFFLWSQCLILQWVRCRGSAQPLSLVLRTTAFSPES